jgi:O-antigen ligase
MLSGNYLGITVGMVFPFMAVVIVRARSFFQSLMVVATFGVAMWMVVLAASRSGMLVVFLSILISWALLLRGSIRGWGLGALVVIALFALLLLAPPTFWARMGTVLGETNSLNGVSASAAESTADREQLLKDSITYTLEHPILGVGIGNFAIVRGVRSGGDPGAWLGTHNLFTQISSENGIPALLLYLALVVVLLKNLARIAFSPARDPETAELRLCARASVVSIVVFIYAGSFAHLAYDYYFYYLAGIGVGLQAAARNLEHHSGEGDDAPAFLRPAYRVQGPG